MKLITEVLVVYIVSMSLTVGFVCVINQLVKYVKEKIK